MKFNPRLLVVLLFYSAFSFGQDMVLKTPLHSACNQEMLQIQDSIYTYFYGVAGTGFIGNDEYIGKDCTAKKQWAGPWKPVDGYKRTVCGYLSVKKRKTPFISSEKERYHLISDGDGDMVIYIIPDPAFRWLQFNSLRHAGHLHKDYTIAGEVAIKEPEGSAESNAAAYLKSLNLDSIQFKPVCFYGPWVSDVRNENSPEIHPLQQMWRREQHSDSVVEYQLYSFFDNSSRYDEKEDFNGPCTEQVWMPNPLLNTFYIPFRISISGNYRLVYDITVPSQNNINSYPSQSRKQLIEFDGITKVEIALSDSAFPRVSFYNVCQAENSINGYVKIETSVGRKGTDDGAHAALKVIQTLKKGSGFEIKIKN